MLNPYCCSMAMDLMSKIHLSAGYAVGFWAALIQVKPHHGHDQSVKKTGSNNLGGYVAAKDLASACHAAILGS
jgi:hypothetical protein